MFIWNEVLGKWVNFPLLHTFFYLKVGEVFLPPLLHWSENITKTSLIYLFMKWVKWKPYKKWVPSTSPALLNSLEVYFFSPLICLPISSTSFMFSTLPFYSPSSDIIIIINVDKSLPTPLYSPFSFPTPNLGTSTTTLPIWVILPLMLMFCFFKSWWHLQLFLLRHFNSFISRWHYQLCRRQRLFSSFESSHYQTSIP